MSAVKNSNHRPGKKNGGSAKVNENSITTDSFASKPTISMFTMLTDKACPQTPLNPAKSLLRMPIALSTLNPIR